MVFYPRCCGALSTADRASVSEVCDRLSACFQSVTVQTVLCICISVLFGAIIGISANRNSSAGHIASSAIGWSYFCAWAISFWPQVILNQRRRSVSGLSRDMVFLATLGFVCYLSYNAALCAPDSAVSREYVQRFNQPSAVTPPDVAFAAFGVAMNLVVILQMVSFDPGNWWKLSRLWASCLFVLTAAAICGAVVAGSGAISWLSYISVLSWVKLAVTFVKYTPQVVLNWRRGCTVGFHVLGVTLDLTGSVMSLIQLSIDCAIVGSFSLVVGDPVKFGLGLMTMVFDVVLIAQHVYFSNSHAGLEIPSSASSENSSLCFRNDIVMSVEPKSDDSQLALLRS